MAPAPAPPPDPTALLASPLPLPSGKTAPNRLTKAAMAEMLGKFGGSSPTPALLNLYRQWARGGWGMIITGNVAVERTHLGMPFDVALPQAARAISLEDANAGRLQTRSNRGGDGDGRSMWPSSNQYGELVSRFAEYAQACRPAGPSSSTAPLVVVQLVHAGRQSIRGFGRALWSSPLAPSSIPMRTTQALGPLGPFIDWLLWSHPTEMSTPQVKDVIEQFAASAKICADAGFDGVEIHASHGYLLSAFLSPRTNTRTDSYGGSTENRLRILLEIIDAIRARVPSDFLIGVKLNSSDYIAGGLTEEDALENVRMLASHARLVDFVEISGGNYENPSFMGENFDSEAEKVKAFGPSSTATTANGDQEVTQGWEAGTQELQEGGPSSKRKKRREAFFLSFASRARDVVHSVHSSSSSSTSKAPMRIIVTGGLRTRNGMAECVAQGGADGVGLGRASAMDPHLPLRILARDDAEGGEVGVRKYEVPGAGILSKIPIQIVGAGWTTLWYTVMLHWLAHASPTSGRQPATKSQPIDAGPLRAALIVAFGSWAVPKEKEEE
ncbi:hypothetical protein A4X06_0g6485 [Tilletia controversa]|uniref:NADH:flavin oxidoreductase/NADH oxidase N-terminal domain-containing protein n=1 Tax=Tilletia controversa TaxID=13291 RepID=A0A8X7MNL0_9BASI|nr:hypothetical protein CF328_g5995 [Tilletia controversa]KAE8243196.1 hypothetical protein A4X06_0g6485 [Tilletia controversa]